MKFGFEIRSVCLELWILTREAEVNSVSMLMAVSRNSSQAYIEKDDSKKLKQKQREKMQPKMGKMDIDYQVLHDSFFKHQNKPKLTSHGDLYYEGKEFEVKLREMKPGTLSQELKKALDMPEGAPPPWLINMQRYGLPPSYPQLKISGLLFQLELNLATVTMTGENLLLMNMGGLYMETFLVFCNKICPFTRNP